MTTTKVVTLNLTTIIITVAILLLLGFGGWKIYSSKINSLNTKLETEVKFRSALLDTIHSYKNKEGEWAVEKKTLQISTTELQKNISEFNSSQKELVNRINNIKKNNILIAAALIKTTVKIDSMNNIMSGSIDTIKNIIPFSDSTKDIKFDLFVEKAKPINFLIKPTLTIKKLELPNTQFIDFYWKDNKKEGYPIAFSVSNSNQYFKTYDINSYAIPALNKDALNPTFWQKVGSFFNKTSGKLVIFGIGGAAGIAVGHFLLK